MGKIKILFLSIVISFLLEGCWIFFIPPETKEIIQSCYCNKDSALHMPIRINGVYYIKKFTPKSDIKYPYDTIYEAFVFWADGFFEKNPKHEIFERDTVSVQNKASFFKYGSYGCYEIVKDTIYAKYVASPGGMSWGGTELKFEIINDSTIKRINLDHYGNEIRMETIKNHELKQFYYHNKCKFIPLKLSYGSDDSWLKRKPWFWCNKEQYRAWKKEQREERRKNRK